MISKQLLEMLFDAANMQRWNDHIRPHRGFVELDKQAHKMVFAYVIGKLEEAQGTEINWRSLIEGGIFEFLHRIKLTDLKPPVFHKLMDRYGSELNQWVLDQIAPAIANIEDNFYNKMSRYLQDTEYWAVEKKILKAAHYLATEWEFKLIYDLNKNLYGINETKASVDNQIEEHFELQGVQKLNKKLREFLDFIGQLRFQQRWANSPRVPETSVMGHMLIVAILTYLVSVEIGSCEKRIYNNFFGGLFHDLPEVLTRDIISPVKEGVSGLDDFIKEIEKEEIEERLLPLLPLAWHKELRYFIEDEFNSKIVKENIVVAYPSDEIQAKYNLDAYSPIDGEVIRICDKLAAFIEASMSIEYGIRSRQLEGGKASGYEKYSDAVIAGFEFKGLFDAFM
ncbi:MAG: HD domain-containing protein [Acidobacteriota bacterium]